MKKTLIMIAVFFIVFIPGIHYSADAATFPDFPTTHYNYNAVKSLTENGIIAGYEDGTFRPEREITRTEFCAMMSRALGYRKGWFIAKDMPFSDVSRDYWGFEFISFCYESTLINGMGDGTFAPAEKVTVAQAVKMAVCAAGKESEALSIKGEKWYSGYMAVAESIGILNRVSQNADEYANRSNAAQVVYNMMRVRNGMHDFLPKPEGADNNIPKIEFTDEEIAEINNVFENKDYSDLRVILVDPGHNYSGKDIGARIDEENVREEIITWQIADKLRKKLLDLGYEVYMTRENLEDNIANTSTSESLQARVDLAHKVLADLYISVHCNMGGGTGTETYCFSLGGYSARLAKLVQTNITKALEFYNRGVKTADFFVVKNTAMPSILIETGFLDNEKDREVLVSEEGQELIAQAIADAVWEYDSMEPIQPMIETASEEIIPEEGVTEEVVSENTDELFARGEEND